MPPFDLQSHFYSLKLPRSGYCNTQYVMGEQFGNRIFSAPITRSSADRQLWPPYATFSGKEHVVEITVRYQCAQTTKSGDQRFLMLDR